MQVLSPRYTATGSPDSFRDLGRDEVTTARRTSAGQGPARAALNPAGRYGFHDLRRAFATMNADELTPDTLQALLGHKSYQTTQRYINTARQMDAAVASLHVPEVLKQGTR